MPTSPPRSKNGASCCAWLERGYDVAIGSREGQGAVRYNEPGYRHLMGRVFNKAVQLIALRQFNDTQCGFKAFTHAASTRPVPLGAALRR